MTSRWHTQSASSTPATRRRATAPAYPRSRWARATPPASRASGRRTPAGSSGPVRPPWSCTSTSASGRLFEALDRARSDAHLGRCRAPALPRGMEGWTCSLWTVFAGCFVAAATRSGSSDESPRRRSERRRWRSAAAPRVAALSLEAAAPDRCSGSRQARPSTSGGVEVRRGRHLMPGHLLRPTAHARRESLRRPRSVLALTRGCARKMSLTSAKR